MGSKAYDVKVHPLAVRRLATHIEFLDRISEAAATGLYRDYEDALAFIKSSPESCPTYVPTVPIEANFKYKLFGKRYRMVFEIVGNLVYVQDIQDCRQADDKKLM